MKKPAQQEVAAPVVVAKQEATQPGVVTGTALVVANEQQGKKDQPQPEVVQLERVDQEEAQPEVVLPKCATAKKNKAKPQPKMLRKITYIGKHPGVALRIKRYHLYRVGMTLQHCKETDGLDHLDILYYVDNGLMKLSEPTKAEVEAFEQQWLKKHSA